MDGFLVQLSAIRDLTILISKTLAYVIVSIWGELCIFNSFVVYNEFNGICSFYFSSCLPQNCFIFDLYGVELCTLRGQNLGDMLTLFWHRSVLEIYSMMSTGMHVVQSNLRPNNTAWS